MLFVSCPIGLETLLKQELHLLGIAAKKSQGGVQTQPTLKNLYTINYASRLSIRTLWPVHHFRIWKARNLYQQMRKIPWDQWLNHKQTFVLRATGKHSCFTNLQFACQLGKDAIADLFYDKYSERPSVDKTNPDLAIHLHFQNDSVIISLDASGFPLNQRGYRNENPSAAPLNESVAAAMVLFSGSQKAQTIFDPCCGSATLLIESAMAHCKIPPGYFRTEKQSWAFVKWACFDAKLFAQIRAHYDEQIRSSEQNYLGYEMDLDVAKNAQKIADVLSPWATINIMAKSCKEANNHELLQKPYTLLSNPPFGKRITLNSSTTGFIHELAKRANYTCLLTPDINVGYIQAKPSKQFSFMMSGQKTFMTLWSHSANERVEHR